MPMLGRLQLVMGFGYLFLVASLALLLILVATLTGRLTPAIGARVDAFVIRAMVVALGPFDGLPGLRWRSFRLTGRTSRD